MLAAVMKLYSVAALPLENNRKKKQKNELEEQAVNRKLQPRMALICTP